MMTSEQGQESRDHFAVNANRQLRHFQKYQVDGHSQVTQHENNKAGAEPFDPRLFLDKDVYSHGTELYVDRPSNESYGVRQDSYNHDQAPTPKDQFTMAQLTGSKAQFMFADINDLKDPVAQYAAAKYGNMMQYNKLAKAEEFEFPQAGEFYLGPPVPAAQQDVSYNWQARAYPMYQDARLGGTESINSTVDGDSVDDIDETIGPDGTHPPANKRDPIYTAISGLKWKAKSKKWVVRWDNPITNRRVYKYFSGVRYGFMGAHKRAKYYLEFLNASVGRLEAPSVGNPFCRRTEGPPKGKTNKGLMRRLMNRGRNEALVKSPMMYAYKPMMPYHGNMEYAQCVPSSPYDQQPKYSYGSSMKDPYCLENGVIGGY